MGNDLFLGRFLNEELDSMPDIDLDFPRDIRERLIPLVHERHGADRSALVAAISTYRARGAVRDLGKALGLPPGEVERLARSVDVYEASADAPARMEEALGRLRARSPRWKALAELLPEIAGLPRHISQHPGGMIISTKPLVELCPVQPAAMEGRQIVQWDKDSCADAGFLKIDLLGLGMLSAVERCVDEIARTRDERIDLSRVPLDDGEVWGAIQRAETTGVFQIESRAQMQMLPRTLPADLDDLTVQVALVRPGPIQGGAVHPYIERRKALRADPSYEVPYEHPSLEPVLKDTLGAIVFQDQVLEVAIALAGFSVGEAEGLRRAMSRRRSEAAMRRYQQRFVEGAVGRGVERDGRRARLRPDRRLLGLRLPQVPLGGVRPARLPVDLAAGPLRPRVPLRPAERAADGLLPARRPGPRGPAPRPRGPAARRQHERAGLPGRDGRRRARARRASRRSGSASATSTRSPRRTPRP